MNGIKYLLLFALCWNFTLLRAQENKENSVDPYKEIYDLKKGIDKKDDIIKKLEKELAKAKADKNKADSLLNVEKAVGKSKELKTRLQELENENKKLKSDLEICAANVQKAVSEQAQQSEEQIQKLLLQHSKDSMELVSLKKDLDELSGFRKMWLTQLAESVNEKWLDKKYSEINVTELESALQQYEEFASADNRIREAADKLKVLLGDCLLYQQCIIAVNSRYDADVVNTLVTSVQKLLDRNKKSDNEKELSLLYWQLDNYAYTVEVFQDVIKAVDKVIDGQSLIWPLAKAELDGQEKEEGNITAIKRIPWLSDRYLEYCQAMEKGDAKNSVRDLILSLQP